MSSRKSHCSHTERRSCGVVLYEPESHKEPNRSERNIVLPANNAIKTTGENNERDDLWHLHEYAAKLQNDIQSKERSIAAKMAEARQLEKLLFMKEEAGSTATRNLLWVMDCSTQKGQAAREMLEHYHKKLDDLRKHQAKLAAYEVQLSRSNAEVDAFREQMVASDTALEREIVEKREQLQSKLAGNKSLETEVEAKCKDNRELDWVIERNRFHISIIRLQMMKSVQLGLYYSDITPSQSRAFEYICPKEQRSKKVGLLEVVYYVTSCLYPRMANTLAKICYQSKVYEVLLKGEVDPSLTAELVAKMGATSEVEARRGESTRTTKQLIVVASSDRSLIITLKAKLTEHMLCFNNQVIKIHYLSFFPVKEGLEQIRIVYNLGPVETTRSIYLMSVESPPTLEQLQFITDRKRRSNISELFDLLGNDRRIYALIDIPRYVHESEEKAYQDAVEFVRKYK